MSLGFVPFQSLFHPVIDHLLVLLLLHIDEVADDQTPDISQAQLTRDFVSGLKIGWQNSPFEVFGAFVAAGITVDGDHRFGLINHNVAAAFQPDLTMKSIVDLLLHAKTFKDWTGIVVKHHAPFRAAGNLSD